MSTHSHSSTRGTPLSQRSSQQKFFYFARIFVCFATFGFVFTDAFND